MADCPWYSRKCARYSRKPSEGTTCCVCGVLFTPIYYWARERSWRRVVRQTCGSPACSGGRNQQPRSDAQKAKTSAALRARGARHISKGLNCLRCGVLFTSVFYWRGRWNVRKRKTCPTCCPDKLEAISTALKGKPTVTRGPKAWNWRGGKTERSGRGRGWVEIRQRVRKKHKHRCAKCGRHEEELGHTLHVHHKVPFHHFSTAREANRLSNLEPLCNECHMKVEAGIEVYQMRLNLSGTNPGQVRGSRSAQAKLTEELVVQIRARLADGIGPTAIARQFGVAAFTIYDISRGRTWRHVPITNSEATPGSHIEFALE